MSKSKNVSLSLNEETNEILTEFKDQTKINKSELIRKLLNFFNKHPKKLREILIEELGLEGA